MRRYIPFLFALWLALAPVQMVIAAPLGQEPSAINECDEDDRVASTDSRVGRLAYVSGGVTTPFCTAWLIPNGAVLTAGHCMDCDSKDGNGVCQPINGLDWAGRTVVLEFNVPASTAGGAPQPAPANDIFPVLVNSARYSFPGGDARIGRDWGIFAIGLNANTQLSAHATRGFIRLTNRNPPGDATIRVTGYGSDDGAANQTLQTATGDYDGEDDNDGALFHEYTAYSSPGASGGPALWDNNGFAIGINSQGGCDQFLGFGPSNKATSLDNTDLAVAIQDFWGPGVIYVDPVPHVGDPNGFIYNPYNRISQALAVAGAGTRISMVGGNYPEVLVIDKAVILVAPVGEVVIGQ
jgi:V8-like Glu-specific endopeptidase